MRGGGGDELAKRKMARTAGLGVSSGSAGQNVLMRAISEMKGLEKEAKKWMRKSCRVGGSDTSEKEKAPGTGAAVVGLVHYLEHYGCGNCNKPSCANFVPNVIT